MGIMDMFRSAPEPQPQPQAKEPEQQQQQQQQQEEATSFKGMENLWAPPEPEEGEQQPQGIDPKKFMEAAGKIDFSKVISQDDMAAITAGGEDAVKAFASAMNKMSQSVYAQSAYASTKLIERAIADAKSGFMKDLPTHIKRQNMSDSLLTENPAFRNPAVKPIISVLQSQIATKYPDATSTEVNQMVNNYLKDLGSAFTTPQQETPATNAPEEFDWSQYLTSNN